VTRRAAGPSSAAGVCWIPDGWFHGFEVTFPTLSLQRTERRVGCFPLKTKPLPEQGLGRCVAQLLLCGFGLGVLAAEALDPAGGIHKLLLAGEERMAGRADFYVDVAFMGRSCGKAAAARAHDAYFVVSGMNGCLHGVSKLIRDIRF